jgi:hypothetical protein
MEFQQTNDDAISNAYLGKDFAKWSFGITAASW